MIICYHDGSQPGAKWPLIVHTQYWDPTVKCWAGLQELCWAWRSWPGPLSPSRSCHQHPATNFSSPQPTETTGFGAERRDIGHIISVALYGECCWTAPAGGQLDACHAAPAARAAPAAGQQRLHQAGDLHCPTEGADTAALPAPHLHLVLGHPAKMFQIQDTDEDRVQNRGNYTLLIGTAGTIDIDIVNFCQTFPDTDISLA